MKECEWCGEEFVPDIPTRKYCCFKPCSVEGRFAKHREDRTCEACGETFNVIKSSANKTCSVKCGNKLKCRKTVKCAYFSEDCSGGGMLGANTRTGLCKFHAQRKKSGLSMTAPKFVPKTKGKCAISNCDLEEYASELCKAHKQRQWKGWSDERMLEPIKKHLKPGEVSKGYVTADGYKMICYKEHDGTVRNMMEHRYVYEQAVRNDSGDPNYILPQSIHIHHKDRDRLNNDISNLEPWRARGGLRQPSGARAEDLLAYARQIIEDCEPVVSATSSR